VNIEILRNIGKRLLREIPATGKISKNVVAVGASGDKTYQVDRAAEDIILQGMEESGDSLTVVSEEIGVKEIKGGGKKVLIDPVDGSRNAVSGIPFYCTSIAVADGNTIGSVEKAYVVNLVNGDEFWAEKGRGAFLNGDKIKTQQDDIFYLTAYEAQSPAKDTRRIISLLSVSRKVRCLGAIALDLSYLSCGAMSVFANPSPSRSFDFAGGWLLVKEAGGIFTDLDGNAIDEAKIGLEKSVSLLASGNMRLHEKALKLLSSASSLLSA
jgi:myo-inositol-1(or 4)-monophosphatase